MRMIATGEHDWFVDVLLRRLDPPVQVCELWHRIPARVVVERDGGSISVAVHVAAMSTEVPVCAASPNGTKAAVECLIYDAADADLPVWYVSPTWSHYIPGDLIYIGRGPTRTVLGL